MGGGEGRQEGWEGWRGGRGGGGRRGGRRGGGQEGWGGRPEETSPPGRLSPEGSGRAVRQMKALSGCRAKAAHPAVGVPFAEPHYQRLPLLCV